MGSVSRTVVFSETGHCALLQLFDPLDFLLEAIANVDSEPWVFGVEDVSLWAALEGVGVSSNQVFESGDPGIKFQYFGGVVSFPLFDCFE